MEHCTLPRAPLSIFKLCLAHATSVPARGTSGVESVPAGVAGSCKCTNMPSPLRLFGTGQDALAEASQGRRATQRGSCYGSKPAQRVRFGIEHNVIGLQAVNVPNRR